MPAVPREKYPEMDWRVADKIAAWRKFKHRMEVIFVADQVPEERQYALKLVAGGDEAYNCWDTLEDMVENPKEVKQVSEAFEKSFEQSTSFWHFRDAYLGDFRQDDTETTANLDLHIKQIVRGCQWHKDAEEEHMIDLLYHATIYYEVHKYIQKAEPNTLKYEMFIEKAKAHKCNILEYKDHQAFHGGANSMPSYNNLLLSAHALAKRRPSGRHSNQHCGRCGKSHERGNCPTYGKTCGKCQGINHFRAICDSKVTAAKAAESPHREKRSPQHRWTPSAGSNNGKGGGKQSKKKMPKKPPKQKAYTVTIKSSNSVPSGTTSGGEREKQQDSNVSKTVLSVKVPEEEGMYNRFSCFTVQSKLAQSTNAKSLYTDTDPDYRSEIITDVTIRVPGKAGTMMMEVKVDPGAQPSCIPLHIFKTMFPHLCRDGLLREELLDTTQNEFQSYNGADMTCYGYLLIDVKDKVSKKYHPIRFYVINTDVPRILISHAASYWLGLVKVLCA